MSFIKSFFLGSALVAVLLMASGNAKAFSIDPALIDTSVQPGAAYTNVIQIKNDEEQAQTYYLSIQKFIPKGKQGQQDFLPLSDTKDLPSWMYLSSPSIMLEPGESRDVALTIRVPQDAPIGGHYAAIFFSTVPPVVDPSASFAGARTGALVFLTVEGQVQEKLRLTDFSLSSPEKTSHLPVLFRATVQNEGNIHAIIEGTVTVKNVFGQTVSRSALRKLGARVLPGSERELSLSWMKEMPKEGSGFWHEVGEEWRNFAIGPYVATLELEGPGTAELASQTVRFSVWPYRLLAILGGVIVFILLLLAWYKRAILHRAVRKHERSKTS